MKSNKKNFCSIFLTFLLINSCNKNNLQNVLIKELNNDKVILISRIQCSCINKEIEKIYQEDSISFRNYTIFADTIFLNNFSFKNITTHYSQKKLDSIYPENSNLIIINKEKYLNKIIKVDARNSKKIKELL